ncbi:MAG: hypothetical protein F4057_10565 [Acidobacteria bacterium]|nr:hypothetical protein [Acidobacteriota bacterium]MYI75725.1 hypothetical protein [Acidobacteriota bacterium]
MRFPTLTAACIAVAALALTPALAGAQSSGEFRTPWGVPDIQGVWHSSGNVPMERPDEYQGRTTLSDEEADARRAQVAARDQELWEAQRRETVAGGTVGAYNNFWMERGAPTDRTSLLVDPPDGRFPALTADGEYARDNKPRGDDTWEDRHIWERCVTRGGMPNAMFPRSYNNNFQIFQSPGWVAILHEQVHETRLIPLADMPPVADAIGEWNGVPRGRWEGDTLVVTTTNIHPDVSALQPWSAFNSHSGSGEGMVLVERFTRTAGDTLEYAIEVNDPQMYTRPWTVAYPFTDLGQPIYEYACHEGNYGMEGILTGGRAEDAEEAAMKKSE